MANAVPYNPSDILEFSINGLQLDTFEVPEEFEIGHEVAKAIHKFHDETGQPVKRVHAMGAFPIATQWQGELYGKTALHRSYLLDNLCAQQQEVDWIFGPLKYRVLICSYKGKVKHENLVEYVLQLEIIEDLNGVTQALDGTTQFGQIMDLAYTDAQNQLAQAAQYGIPSDISIASGSLTSAIQGLQPLQFAKLSDLQGLLNQINQFTSKLNAYLSPLMNTALTASALGLFNRLSAAMNSYMLMATNLQQIIGISGQVSSAIKATYPAGTSLFAIAAHHYPDRDIPTAAQTIANANGLTSLFLTAQQTLSIPPLFTNEQG